MERLVPFIPWLGGLLSVVCLLLAFKNLRRERLIDALPTSRALGVFIGLVEMKGAAESEAPLCSRLAEADCVHYEWQVEEQWRREKYETVTDSDGKSRRELKTESGWTTVAQGGETQAFYVKDATGAILVHPQGAEIDPQTVFNRSCGPDDDVYYGKGPANDIPDSTHRRKFLERAIRLHAPVYVVGKARERRDIVAAEIAKDEQAALFLISARTEKDVKASFMFASWGWSAAGLAIMIIALIAWDMASGIDAFAHRSWYLPVGGIYAAAWMLSWTWNVFNDLVGLRNRVREGWVLVDIQLKRRHDLIPNLVRIVSALKDHERRIQTQIAALRAQIAATGLPGAAHSSLKTTLIGVQEQYPVLSAMPAFQNLQRNLVDTEERIALARDYYNSIATHYNTRLEQVPDCYVAPLIGMRRFQLLAAENFERAPIKVDFAK